MRIEWSIKKKRGNFRPTLTYTLALEDHEKALAVHSVHVDSQIPYIPRPHESHCLPGENERAENWEPKDFKRLSVPHFKTGEIREFLRLPFRESMEYPEVEEAFRQLRGRFEAVLSQVYSLNAFERTGELGVSRQTAEDVAPAVMAQKLLGLYGESTAA